ncbi:hypothetical protein ACMHYB_54295 [Sorangium sp. So ce1128]
MVAFIARELGIDIEQQTLRPFLDVYGLYVFRPDHDRAEAHVARPTFPLLCGRAHELFNELSGIERASSYTMEHGARQVMIENRSP